MRVKLQTWITETALKVPADLKYGKAGVEQAIFVRDTLSHIIGWGLHYKVVRNNIHVVSQHRSKSVPLPVYEIAREDLGLKFYLRGNFYNWKLSVESKFPIKVDLTGLCYTSPPLDEKYTGNILHPVYFEGFPEDKIYDYYDTSDKTKFSMELGEQDLYTVLFLIMRSVGAVQPYVWHTPESHKAKMEADRIEDDKYRDLR